MRNLTLEQLMATSLTHRTIVGLAGLFGLLTIWQGGAVALNLGNARAAAGDYVPFIVWFNTTAGFAYLATGFGLWRRKPWAGSLALGIAVATALAFAVLALMIAQGTPVEARTVGAMAFRLLVWCALAWYALRQSGRAGATGR